VIVANLIPTDLKYKIRIRRITWLHHISSPRQQQHLTSVHTPQTDTNMQTDRNDGYLIGM